ncbi:glycosyltransferase family 2 protein [Marisediminicola senii]|uniref:glycosyltransferase family 2 protein n=1 Tax=Marisediminicola senii TaxID=2711233 RepID=UPI001912EE8C|nr:glycosyltransferase [Marisediminicola senii]
MPGNRWDLLDDAPTAPGDPAAASTPASPAVSVIVVHYRQQAELDRTLAALARQDYDGPIEVTVVDDGSPVAPVVPPAVRLIVQDDLGFRAGMARNRGARESGGELLVFLDADTTPEPGYVRAITRLPWLAPETVTVGRRRHADLAGTSPDDPIEECAPARAIDEPQWLDTAYAQSRNLLDADDRSYRFVIGAVMACSRWFFDEVGGFDEEFSEYGGEDWEWAYRSWARGGLLAHVPAAVAWHDGPDWSGRSTADDDRMRRKNAETLILASAIPVAGSRGLAVRSRRADSLVRVPDGFGAAATFVTVDSLLTALPHAVVIVPDEHASLFAPDDRVLGNTESRAAADTTLALVRVEVAVRQPVRVDAAAFAAAVARFADPTLGSLSLRSADAPDTELAVIASVRARYRTGRWNDDTLFDAAIDTGGSVTPIAAEPDVEAYLGGWG